MINKIKLPVAKDGVHLLVGPSIRLDMLQILALQDVAGPNGMAASAQLYRQVSADETTAAGDQYIRHI
jgi:hypothetical protein